MKVLFSWLLLCLAGLALAGSHVKWTAALVPADARAGESAQIVMTAQIEAPWHIYKLKESGGPSPTSFELGRSPALAAQGEAIEPAPKNLFDPNFQANVGEFETAVSFTLPVKIAATANGTQKVVITAHDQTCNAHVCAIPESVQVPLTFTVAPGQARPDHQLALTTAPSQPAGYSGGGTAAPAPATAATSGGSTNDVAAQVKDAEKKGLLYFILFSFGFGLIALLTPCVFAMIPITVSYFAKAGGAEPARKNYAGASIFCFGIICTFTVLGLGFTTLFKGFGIDKFAANPWVNLFLGALFIVLALSLFGLFEIRLPNSVVNKAHQQSRKGGLAAPFFMGLTFTLTSFTCTAPLVGALLGEAAQGQILYPLIGLFSFGVAFALPFFLLALFPQFLADLPKSGSWLNTVKGFMGFVEIAAAVKFLSNADLVWQLGVLTRPVFLALWAIVGVVTALYLFGLVRVEKEMSQVKIGAGRSLIAVLTVGAAVLFLSGVGGNTRGLGSYLLAWLPPVPYPGQAEAGPGEIKWISKYDDAVAQAKLQNKAMFIDFTGVTCTNCRAMEEQVFPVPEVRKLIDTYIPVQLYTDRPTADDRFNADLEQKLSQQSTLPMYVIVSPDGKPIKAFSGYNPDAKAFVAFLESGHQSKVALR